jgi:hypothetical protein
LALYTASGFIIVDKNFFERKFPVELLSNDSYASGSVFYKFDGNLVFYVKDYWDKKLYSVDEAGNVFEAAEYEESVLYVKDVDFKEPVYSKNDVYYLQDKNKNILLSHNAKNEQGEYEKILSLRGNFVVLEFRSGEGMYPRTIYSLDGKLLIDDIYGITDSPAPGGGVFVYKTPDNCIVIYPNGDTAPVFAAPAVKKIIS